MINQHYQQLKDDKENKTKLISNYNDKKREQGKDFSTKQYDRMVIK